MPATTSTILIEELAKAGGAVARALVLSGPTLPAMGAEWGGEMQAKVTWYPGSSRGTRQVIGPKAIPSSWTGEWHLPMMVGAPALWWDETGTPQEIRDPNLLFDVFEDIRNTGRRLRVTWATRQLPPTNAQSLAAGSQSITAFGAAAAIASAQARAQAQVATSSASNWKLVREGGLDKFSAKFDRVEDATWSAEFGWVTLGTKLTPTRGSSSTGISQQSDKVVAAKKRFFARATGGRQSASNPAVLRSATTTTLGQLEAMPAQLEGLVNTTVAQAGILVAQVESAAAIARQLASAPTSVSQQSVVSSRATLAVVLAAEDKIRRRPPELMTTVPFVSSILRGFLRYEQIVEELEELGDEAAVLRDLLQAELASPALGFARSAQARGGGAASNAILTVYQAKPGDTPETVSRAFYKDDGSHGKDICAVNHLPWHTPAFAPGTKLVIPTLQSLGRGGS